VCASPRRTDVVSVSGAGWLVVGSFFFVFFHDFSYPTKFIRHVEQGQRGENRQKGFKNRHKKPPRSVEVDSERPKSVSYYYVKN